MKGSVRVEVETIRDKSVRRKVSGRGGRDGPSRGRGLRRGVHRPGANRNLRVDLTKDFLGEVLESLVQSKDVRI